jgi:hypothetical protein
MRAYAILALVAIAAVAIVAGSGGAASASGHTALTVTYWGGGQQSADRDAWTLRCDPPRGTHPRPAAACRRLDEGGWKLVAPVPPSTICTEIYGGPQVAIVKGVLQGKRIWARFTRENGCQIARWSRLSPWLFPAGGVTR